MIPHEPRDGTLYVGKFFIALARSGAGFVATTRKPAWTPDPRDALRIPDRESFRTLCAGYEWKAADFKLIACTDEMRIGPKPKPVVAAPTTPAGVTVKRTRKKKGGAGGQPSLEV